MKIKTFGLLLTIMLLQSCFHSSGLEDTTSIALDKEHRIAEDKVINSSTQSLNRYASNMRKLSDVTIREDGESRISVTLENKKEQQRLELNNIDLNYIVPQLPYPRATYDKFDIANIVLAEYSRNGIGIPIQSNNELFASVRFSENLFNDKGEYIFEGGKYQPNFGVLPKRISLVNNCLRPGLWELSASDAVGEMYHGWFELDRDFYFSLLEKQTGIPKDKIPHNFDDPAIFEDVSIDFDRLRVQGQKIAATDVTYNDEKLLGSYSNQDSRRKVQRKFYKIQRDGEDITVKHQGELMEGDKYAMFSFEEPGIYNPVKKTEVAFTKKWATAEVYEVTPKTSYYEGQEFLKTDYLEIRVFDESREQAMVFGNIPLALLSVKNDFVIPSFGVGVFLASEPLERRYLRRKQGPRPSFAYLANVEGDDFKLINNHLHGYEQVYLRTVEKDGQFYVRCTLVSYERITDLIEFDINMQTFKQTLVHCNANYKPPVYETYRDDNTL